MQPSIGDMEQYYGTWGVLSIRWKIPVWILFQNERNPPLDVSFNWIILSIIQVIIQYLITFNSSNVLGILDQIIWKASFGVRLDVLLMHSSKKSS